MNKKTTPYIYILFFLFFSTIIWGQKKDNFSLKIISVDSVENKLLKSLRLKTTFPNKKELLQANNRIIESLKTRGYYTIVNDSIITKNNLLISYVNIGKKIMHASLTFSIKNEKLLKSLDLTFKNNTLFISGNKLKETLSKISEHLINNGESFSKVKLKNISIHNTTLKAHLSITRSPKRTTQKVIVKDYKDFPKTYIKNYLNINSNSIINPITIEQISEKINQLDFATEFKKPEILFSKDSTILFLYIKKTKANSFDGLINFNSENEKLKFRGHFDIKLTNAFNKGEKINLFWRNNGDNKQELFLSLITPYIYMSKITPKLSFHLFKSDSTFTNRKFNSSISYPINRSFNFSIQYNNESSTTIEQTNSLKNFKKTSIGFNLEYLAKKSNQLSANIGVYLNKRTTETSNSFQQIDFSLSSIITISPKLEFHLKNNSKITTRNTNLINELFRSGGVNSIRGFANNSILSNSYTFFNTEFRLNSQQKNFLFSIHDIGVFNINNQYKTLSSIGIGYQFSKNNNTFNIAYTIKNPTESNIVNSSMLSIKMLTLF